MSARHRPAGFLCFALPEASSVRCSSRYSTALPTLLFHCLHRSSIASTVPPTDALDGRLSLNCILGSQYHECSSLGAGWSPGCIADLDG